jgi:N-acetylgalactosamine-N,N'-diacetylbacillosaminyl-diphospho-undecaprenol 4-alpha-N-acetylgalactosaminyltransferase
MMLKKKKTVFFLINSMENGGAERVLSNILPSLSKKYSLHLILLKNDIFYDLPTNVRITSLSTIKSNVLMLPLFPIFIFKLKRLIKQHQPDKVISFLEIANFVNILSNKKAMISLRISLDFFQGNFIKKVYRLLINKLYPKAQLIIVNSKENRNDLIKKLNLSSQKVLTIHNPLSISTKQELMPSLPFAKSNNTKIFISVGRLTEQKNFSTLIKSFTHTPVNNVLLIIGEGEEENSLKELIKNLNLQKRVFLLGQKKNVYAYLSIADYFIFTSRAEGFPNVLMEAIYYKLPIITSDFKTGAREVIDPNLTFEEKIKYPHYGPNGVLLSLENFTKDFQKINFQKLTQEQTNLASFNRDSIISQWQNVIELMS